MIELFPHKGEELYGNSTDPTQHDPTDFEYFIHKDTGIHEVTRRSRILDIPKEFSSQYLLQDPHALRGIHALWGSVVNQDHFGIFEEGRFALILKVLKKGVRLTEPNDTSMSSVTQGLARARRVQPMSSKELLHNSPTYRFGNNRVLFNGNAVVAITGLIDTLPHHITSPLMAEDEAYDLARQHGLPIIKEHRLPSKLDIIYNRMRGKPSVEHQTELLNTAT